MTTTALTLAPPPAAHAETVVPSSIAALGDSITRGANACGRIGDCTGISWATGATTGIGSHYQRLRGLDAAITGNVANLARSGSKVSSLPAQAAAAVTRRPDYVTILIGGNDVCAPTESRMTSVASFRRSAQAAMDTLATGSPEAKVMVASIPDLRRLWLVAKDNARARYVWSYAKVCQSMLANPTSTATSDAERRERVHQRVVAYNEVLREVCATNPNCRYDGGAVFRYPFSLRDFSSLDYFHPSAAGQAAIARLTWASATAQFAPH